MTVAAKPTTAPRNLKAELAAAEQALAAATAAGEALASEEEAALESETDYINLERRKKLSAREVERCRMTISALKVEVDNELAAEELARFNRVYDGVDGRNTVAVKAVGTLRLELVPQMLQIALDIAQDEIDVAWINARVPHSRRIHAADRSLRSQPAIDRKTVAEETIELWTIRNGQILTDQNAVQFDDNGQPFLKAGGSKYWAHKKPFRRVETSYFQPARDAPPLWRVLEVPSLDRSGQPIYSGKEARSPEHAIQLLKAAIDRARAEPFEPYIATSTEFIPLDADGNPIRVASGPDTPPPIREESASSMFPLLPPDVRRSE